VRHIDWKHSSALQRFGRAIDFLDNLGSIEEPSVMPEAPAFVGPGSVRDQVVAVSRRYQDHPNNGRNWFGFMKCSSR